MTKEDIKKFMPLMQAMLEGKTIQCYHKLNKEWVDIDDLFIGNDISLYRIKPEPKYRPFKNVDECWAEMQKHQPFGWLYKKGRNVLIAIYMFDKFAKDKHKVIYVGGFWYTLEHIFDNYTFADGTPFGIKME